LQGPFVANKTSLYTRPLKALGNVENKDDEKGLFEEATEICFVNWLEGPSVTYAQNQLDFEIYPYFSSRL
jgi:hypothetical protein